MTGGFERIKPIELTRLAKTPGMHCDGRGLYLKVVPTGGASWILRYMLNGTAHTMGLGGYPERSLKEARRRAMDARRLKSDGIDPLEVRRAARVAKHAASNVVTFENAATDFITSKQGGWRDGGKTANQWTAAFRDWVYPKVGHLPVADIDVASVIDILTQNVAKPGEPPKRFWEAKPETASRCRSRLENVLDYAKAHGCRTGDNPAEWATLKFTLPKRGDVRAVQHHPSMPYAALPAFIRALRSKINVSRYALEFTILTAARSSEVVGTLWSEIDLDKKLWIIPGERMKGKKEHRVPLSERAATILAAQTKGEPSDLVFQGLKPGEPLSNNTMRKLLQSLAGSDVTTHGFRSTFAVWVREQTDFPTELAEVSLAHIVGSAVERAYARTDFFDKRRALMSAWADFASSKAI